MVSTQSCDGESAHQACRPESGLAEVLTTWSYGCTRIWLTSCVQVEPALVETSRMPPSQQAVVPLSSISYHCQNLSESGSRPVGSTMAGDTRRWSETTLGSTA